MFFLSDYKLPYYNKHAVNSKIFTVLLNNFCPPPTLPTSSVAHASKPLVYFSKIFGMQNIRYNSSNAEKISILNKFYCVFILGILTCIIVFVPPLSWKETQSDLPLNILTRLFGVLQTFEIFYYVFIVSFGNKDYYWYLYKTLNSLDNHYEKREKVFRARRCLAIFLMLTPPFLVSFTLFLRKFTIHNVVSQITFFIIMLQGVNFVYFIVNIFIEVLIFKTLVVTKIYESIPSEGLKHNCFTNVFINKILGLQSSQRFYCWFEIMQIYDKIADCVYIFNKIYAGQILIMFEAWLLTTVLVLCRSLSPSMKNNNVKWSDAFYYFFLNIRPFFLTKMSDFFIEIRQKILSVLIHLLIQTNGNHYQKQVQTMIHLVQARKLELSVIITTVKMPIMMAFFGKIISYSVLMIQYFYINNI